MHATRHDVASLPSKTQPSGELQKLSSLTGARFIAALMVLLHHGLTEFPVVKSAFGWAPLNSGVGFFFILSGFILAYAHPQIPSFTSALEFWVKRFARIWPVHIAVLLLLVAVVGNKASGGTFQTPGALAANILLLQTWFNDFRYVFSYNSVSWSISVEAFFYAMFPVLIYRAEKTWPLKLAICCAIIVLTCLFYQEQKSMGLIGDNASIPAWAMIQFNPLARLLEFMTGITAFVLWKKHLRTLRLNFSTWVIIELAILGVAAGIWVAMHSMPVRMLGEFGRGWFYQVGMVIVPALLILTLLATSRGPLAMLLGSRPFVFLGEISFSLYMVHQVVLRWYQSDRSVFADAPSHSALVFYITASLLGAFLLWRFVEVPCRQQIIAAFRERQGRGLQQLG